MRLRQPKTRRWRVSVYGPGVADILPRQYPMAHRASRSREIAQRHFARFAARLGDGVVGRVILHQGKLDAGYSQRIEDDTRWRA